MPTTIDGLHNLPLAGGDFVQPVYQNSRFIVAVGYPEQTRERPTPKTEYLIWNKETGVQEYSHSVLLIAKDWADNFARLMDEPPKSEIEAAMAPAEVSFN